MWQWKNFENRPVFDEVMCRLRRLTFLAHPVYWSKPTRYPIYIRPPPGSIPNFRRPAYAEYTSPTRLNCWVVSCRRCERTHQQSWPSLQFPVLLSYIEVGDKWRRNDIIVEQENSAKLTNQRVSCAFTSSSFSFHVRHILPTSKFQNSYSCILLIFLQTSVNNMCENCDCECDYSTLVWRFLFRNPTE